MILRVLFNKPRQRKQSWSWKAELEQMRQLYLLILASCSLKGPPSTCSFRFLWGGWGGLWRTLLLAPDATWPLLFARTVPWISGAVGWLRAGHPLKEGSWGGSSTGEGRCLNLRVYNGENCNHQTSQMQWCINTKSDGSNENFRI